MEIKLRQTSNIIVLDIRGEMDLYNAYKLKELIKKMIARKMKNFILNMESVEYIDSSGIGALLYVYSEIKKRRLNLRISNVKGPVKKVIELTKLMEYLPIKNTNMDAIEDLKKIN